MPTHTDQDAADKAVQAAVAAALPDALASALPEAIRDALAEAGVSLASPERSLLTKKGLAKHLNVSLTSIDGLLSRGDIIPIRVGGSVRFSWEAVDDYKRRHAGRPRRRRSGRIAA